MPGTEASLVLGAISSIIKLVDASKEVYDTATSTDGLPEAFREVAARLPIVANILGSANQCIDNGDVDEDSCKGVKYAIEACEIKARKLNELFCEVISADGASRLNRYRKAIKAYGKGNEVENLMKGILENVLLLTCERGLRTASSVQQYHVSKAIEEVIAIPSSMHEAALQGTGFTVENYGPGAQTNYIAQGENIAQGEARQYNSMGGDMHFAQTRLYAITQNISILQGPKEIKACLEALFLTNPRDDREALVQTKGPRVRGTCEWIKTNELYSSWLQSSSQLLWLSGGPGKGKTMISIFVAEELEQTAANTQDTLFLQYYCDNKSDKRNTGVAIIRGLLFQLLQLQPKLVEYILPRFEVEKESLFTLEALWRIFEAMICDATLGTVYCVLDGLDECDESSLLVLLEKLETLFSAGSSSTHRLKLLIVSRDHPEFISEILSHFPCIRLDTHSNMEIDTDVRHFIKVRVDELAAKKKYSPSLRAHVEKFFADRANGTFLWVGIVADQLTKYTWSEVEEALKDHFPPGLEELYARMLLQIERNRRETAAKIFLWVTMAVRPLSLSELSAAIDIVITPSTSFSRDEVMRDKISHCGYFLTVKNDEVSLIHQSAKDYLTRKTPDSNPALEFFRLKEEAGDMEIARKCFDYLQNGALAGGKVDLSSNSLHLKAFPLLSYAALNWPHHAKSVPRSEYIVDPSHPFYEKKSQTRESWLKTYWAATIKEGPPDLFTPLHLASWFGILPLAENILSEKGLVDTISFLFNKRHEINKRDSYGRTALWGAACHQHDTLVQLLLEKGAEIKSEGELGDGFRVTALYWAVATGSIAVLQLLLKKGATVNDAIFTLGRFRATALLWAVRNEDEAVALFLIENGAKINAKIDMGGSRLTLLYFASSIGSTAMVQLLLEKGADSQVEIQTSEGPIETSLVVAAREGHEAVVQLLLKKEADIEVNLERRDAKRAEALLAAFVKEKEAVVQLLLTNGVDVNTRIEIEGGYRVPVPYMAVVQGSETMVRLLLKNGADIQANVELGDRFRTTALCLAAWNGNEAMVRLLLENGADIQANVVYGTFKGTILEWAPSVEHEAVRRLLLEKGADMTSTDQQPIVQAELREV